jgi:hypothetical protein
MNSSREFAEKGLAAMRRAALQARKLAAMHGLKIPIWKDGKVMHIDPFAGQECKKKEQ